jgi:hypothetical protein
MLAILAFPSAKLDRMEAKRLADQIRRSYQGPCWHGPSLRELLDGVPALQAVSDSRWRGGLARRQ